MVVGGNGGEGREQCCRELGTTVPGVKNGGSEGRERWRGLGVGVKNGSQGGGRWRRWSRMMARADSSCKG
ncbi:hypothetical protein M407DRAFT_129318 [Tulasnella calospora MUT 4182]|uniref:Uncharacterized protein n=1 Tax=Tulasnella calospora MUT 4182 TaxID=1051891 RepID=A0A0C3Q089_9AGAM|nr:hypothetical protein M407DRAFT_129318 [Tulasnella calospora MUT 4182]